MLVGQPPANTKPRSANRTQATMTSGAEPEGDAPRRARREPARVRGVHAGQRYGILLPSRGRPLVGWAVPFQLHSSRHDQPSACHQGLPERCHRPRDVSVEIDKGEFVFVVGPSGSGQSTMIRLLLKEEEATRRHLRRRQAPRKMSSWDVPKLRRNVGTVFQDYKLLTDKTVFDNVAFGLEVIGKQKHVIDQRVPEILEYVGLGDKLNNYPDELSAANSSGCRSRAPA